MTDPVPSKDLVSRITAYLAGGGLFNPELANHDAVRDLLIACRDALAAPELAEVATDAERWRIYLQCYDREEMVAAEWDGPAAITAFIDSMRAAQPPGDGHGVVLLGCGDPIPEGGCGCRTNGVPVMRAQCRLHGSGWV